MHLKEDYAILFLLNQLYISVYFIFLFKDRIHFSSLSFAASIHSSHVLLCNRTFTISYKAFVIGSKICKTLQFKIKYTTLAI